VYQHSAAVLTKFFASLVLAILENQSPQGRFSLGKYNRDQLRGTAFGKFTVHWHALQVTYMCSCAFEKFKLRVSRFSHLFIDEPLISSSPDRVTAYNIHQFDRDWHSFL
jgi:hypothetical protein